MGWLSRSKYLTVSGRDFQNDLSLGVALLDIILSARRLGQSVGSGNLRLDLALVDQAADLFQFAAVFLDGVAHGAHALGAGLLLRRLGQRRHHDAAALKHAP